MVSAADLPLMAPIVTLTVLIELAAGTLVATWLIDLRGLVGRGFVGTTAGIIAGVMGVELLVVANTPTTTRFAPSAGSVGSLRMWSAVFTIGLLAYAFMAAVGTDAARRVVGTGCLAAGVAAVGASCAMLAPAVGGPVAALVVAAPGALVLGAATSGMLVGHWYLIAPSLSFKPLREATYAMFAALAVEALTLTLALASRAGQTPLMQPDLVLPFWLFVVGSGIVFTAGVAGVTLYFARIRANQPATAMLYVLIVSALMGVVPAHLLSVLAGAPL